MLSEKEKEAIVELKEEINKPLEVPEDKFDTFILYNIESAKTILNLIEKQSKEIEELNKENTRQHELIGNIHQKWNDKIKAKIEEVDYKMIAHQDVRETAKQVLQSLLEKE